MRPARPDELPVTAAIEPDRDALPGRERAEVQVAVVVDIHRHDRQDPVRDGQDLRLEARHAHEQARLGRGWRRDSIRDTIAVEVSNDGRVRGSREDTHGHGNLSCERRTSSSSGGLEGQSVGEFLPRAGLTVNEEDCKVVGPYLW